MLCRSSTKPEILGEHSGVTVDVNGYCDPIILATRGCLQSDAHHPDDISSADPCPSSELNPREFIGGFDLLAIASIHGDADKRSGPGRPKRTPNPHSAGAGIDRAAPSNCSAGAQPNSSSLLASL
jgi:hypothetical protein